MVFGFSIYRFAVLAIAGLAAFIAPCSARAQGKLEAHYTARLAGLPIGKGTWTIDISEGHYTAAVSAMTTGLIRTITGGQATSLVRGTLMGGNSMASNYSATINTTNKTDEVQLTILGSTVKDYKVSPPIDFDPERVPFTEAQRQGVTDPMTATLIRVPGNGDPRVPEACPRSLSVFDGRLRYNLQMTFKRMDSVKADRGYGGAVVVCAAQFVPVGGYIPTRAAIKYLVASRDIELWLAPIAGTRVMVPFRAQIQTPLGLGVIEASHFVATSTGKAVKTQ